MSKKAKTAKNILVKNALAIGIFTMSKLTTGILVIDILIIATLRYDFHKRKSKNRFRYKKKTGAIIFKNGKTKFDLDIR